MDIPLKTANLRRIGSLIVSLLLLCATTGAANLELPDIGDSTGTILSPEFERRLGQAFLSQVRKQANVIDDPEIEAYIQSIGYRLVSHSDNNTQTFTFFVINDPLINAFAAPGGIVGVNSGVFLHAASESEVAGVMAHEVVHVTQKHVARSFEMQSKMSLPMMAAMIGAILIASQNPEAGQAAMAAIQGGAMQAQINFTRGNEQEADRLGIQLLANAGFNPQGMPLFFEKLQQNSRYAGQAPEFLRTHPLTTNRIADTWARAEGYRGQREYDEGRTYPYIRAKLRVMSVKDPRQAVDYFKQALTDGSEAPQVARYGYALALMEIGDYTQAAEHLRVLLRQDDENLSFLLAAANLEARRNNTDIALTIYESANRIYPDHRPVVFARARTLMQAGRPQEARELLRNYGKFNEPDLSYYEYLTRAEAEAGNQIESGIANAEHYYLSGETLVAAEQLRHLLLQKEPRPDYYQTERIQARYLFFQQELELERDMKLRK